MMVQSIILGAVQGITEWLPVSSEGIIVFLQSGLEQDLHVSAIIRYALFLHLGTFLAALVYFKKDVLKLLKRLFYYRKLRDSSKKVLEFYMIATLTSAFLGFIVFIIIKHVENNFLITSKFITLLIAFMLIITAVLQFISKKTKIKSNRSFKKTDAFLVGLAQGFSAFPGLSRSGLTVSVLLLRKYTDDLSLKISFLLSLPFVLIGNIFLNAGKISLDSGVITALLFSFLFGILTIHFLLKIAKKINFTWFVFAFACILFFSIYI